MLKQIKLQNFTVFPQADLQLAPQLNVIVGENGAGKTHLLKLAYTVLAVSWEEGRKPNAQSPTKTVLQTRLADKLVNVFRPDALGRLATRQQGRARCDIQVRNQRRALDLDFSFATNSKTEVSVDRLPAAWLDVAPTYLPTRELLTIFPNFVSIYDGHYLEFDETWRDLCVLLGAPLQRGSKETRITQLLEPLEEAMDGSVELDQNGRFYLRNKRGRLEMPLVAEGIRKLAMLARLVASGTLLDRGFLFWDEPEANLNPRLIKRIAPTILALANSGIQVFLATHSLFLLRELEILLTQDFNGMKTRFFALERQDAGVLVTQGDHVDDVGEIASLEEDLKQSDRFMAVSEEAMS